MAPEAVSVALLPTQIEVGELEAVIVGLLPTGISKVAVPGHSPAEPVTVYIVLTVGLKATRFPTIFPGFQVYVKAPDATALAVPPGQMVPDKLNAETVGGVPTVIDMVVEPV